MDKRTLGLTLAALYISTVVAANWAIHRYGIVSAGFGLVAPAGVYFAGLAFTLRDLTSVQRGRPRRRLSALSVARVWVAAVPARPDRRQGVGDPRLHRPGSGDSCGISRTPARRKCVTPCKPKCST